MYLQHILRHFADYMGGDDRYDHGFGILKGYRDIPIEEKRIIYRLMGKVVRAYDRLRRNEQDSQNRMV